MDRPSITREFRQTILKEEYLRLCTEIRSIESANDRLIALAFTLMSLAAAVGISQKVDVLFFMLPIAMVGVLIYGAMSYTSIFCMGGYKRHIEELINTTAGENLLLWERLVPERERRNVAGKAILAIYLIVAISIVATSIIRLQAAYHALVAWSFLGGLLVLMFLLLAALRKMSATFAETYRRSKAFHAEPQAPQSSGLSLQTPPPEGKPQPLEPGEGSASAHAS